MNRCGQQSQGDFQRYLGVDDADVRSTILAYLDGLVDDACEEPELGAARAAQ